MRRTSLSSQRLACDGTPSISLYDGITLSAPPSTIALLKAGRNTSRRTRADTLTGAQLVPDSGWPCAAKCLTVATMRVLSAKRVSPWKPLTAATPKRAIR